MKVSYFVLDRVNVRPYLQAVGYTSTSSESCFSFVPTEIKLIDSRERLHLGLNAVGDTTRDESAGERLAEGTSTSAV